MKAAARRRRFWPRGGVKLVARALYLASFVLCCVKGYDMSLPLTQAVCETITAPAAIATSDTLMAKPVDPLSQREHCSVCNIIVQNSRKWTVAGGDLRRMCTGIPPHAQRWCLWYTCQLFLFCPYFYQPDTVNNHGLPCNVSQVSCGVMLRRGSVLCGSPLCTMDSFHRRDCCFVCQGKSGSLGVAPLYPCPAKYVCAYCLDIPTFQTFGCFDGLKV